jgi:hypothetical protein
MQLHSLITPASVRVESKVSMSRPKLLAAAASVALVTSALSLASPSPQARAAGPGVEVQPQENNALPAIAVAGAAGFAAAFLLGALQGYMEAKNQQHEAKHDKHSGTITPRFARLAGRGGLDHVLD